MIFAAHRDNHRSWYYYYSIYDLSLHYLGYELTEHFIWFLSKKFSAVNIAFVTGMSVMPSFLMKI